MERQIYLGPDEPEVKGTEVITDDLKFTCVDEDAAENLASVLYVSVVAVELR
jgi:hypothetical protein